MEGRTGCLTLALRYVSAVVTAACVLVGTPWAVGLENKNEGTGQATSKAVDWREQYAYSAGIQAYIYAYPLIYLAELRHK